MVIKFLLILNFIFEHFTFLTILDTQCQLSHKQSFELVVPVLGGRECNNQNYCAFGKRSKLFTAFSFNIITVILIITLSSSK